MDGASSAEGSAGSAIADVQRFTFGYKVACVDQFTTIGTALASPIHRVGHCSFFLRVYPSDLAASISLVPDVLWSADWSVPNIKCKISIANHLEERKFVSIEGTSTFNTSNTSLGHGWETIDDELSGHGWAELRRLGWLSSDGDLVFKVEIEGGFEVTQPLDSTLSPTAMMWFDTDYSDITVATETGVDFHCHRVVLASASPAFKAMLKTAMKETADNRVMLKDVSASSVRNFLIFIYTGRLPKYADFPELLRLSDMYELPELANRCSSTMVKKLNIGGCCEVRRALDRHKRSLSDEVRGTFIRNVKKRTGILQALSRDLLMDGQEHAFRRKFIDRVLEDKNVLNDVAAPLLEEHMAVE